MPEPKITLLGAYAVEPTPALVEKALNYKYYLHELGEEEKAVARATVTEEIASAVLFELLVENADERFSADDFGQPGSPQAAYLEIYLSKDGSTIVSKYKKPDLADFRVLFFLHFFDNSKPLKTSYREIRVQKVEKMPLHLRDVLPYEPT